MSELTKEQVQDIKEQWGYAPEEQRTNEEDVVMRLVETIESKDFEIESARKNYDELLDEINEEYSKSAALKRIIEEREVELASAKAKIEEQQKEIELKRETIQKYEQTVSLFLDDKESLTKQLEETKEKAREFFNAGWNAMSRCQCDKPEITQLAKYRDDKFQQFLNQTKGGD